MLSQKEVERLYYGLRSHINLQGEEEGQALRALSNEFILRNVNIGESLWDLDSEIGDLHFILEGTFAEYLKRGAQSFILRVLPSR